jgi:hypothetical protein
MILDFIYDGPPTRKEDEVFREIPNTRCRLLAVLSLPPAPILLGIQIDEGNAMNTEFEMAAQQDMERFLQQNPKPANIDSPEFYEWNRKRVQRAREFVDYEAIRFLMKGVAL